MQWQEFLKISLFTIAGTVGLIILTSSLFPFLASHVNFSLATVAVFSIISLGAYVFGNIIADSPNKYLYNNLIVINFIAKLFFSIATVFIYVSVFTPNDNHYMISFVVIYLIFTAYELYFMTRQAKTKR